MPHKCVKCSTTYEDGSNELLEGCSDCGGKFFLYIKKEHLAFAQDITKSLTDKQKDKLEKDALDLVGETEEDKPVVLDLESVSMLKEGKFELDLTKLFNNEPLIYKISEGKYVIDVVSTLQQR